MSSLKELVWVALLAVLPAVTASAAWGCEGGLLDVAQPMVDSQGISVSIVTYSRSCLPSLIIPGYEVCFVGKPNCVPLDDQIGGFENLNAASIVGITATVDSFHMKTNSLFGDTLHAIIDLSGLKAYTPEVRRQLGGWSIEAVVRATVEAVLLNAYNDPWGIPEPDTGLVKAKHVWVEIRGSAEYDSLSGVFSLETYDPLSRGTFFW